jgi:hypothetical protein
MADITVTEAQSRSLKYPEGGWVGICGSYFPSEVQWLYKTIVKTTANSTKSIPSISTTVFNKLGSDDMTTFGSGTTSSGVSIEEKVSLDWLRYAIQRRLWSLLYNQEKIDSTDYGKQMFLNELVYVLDISVKNNIIKNYVINSSSVNRVKGTISVDFKAELTNTILSVNVAGSLYK